MKLSEEFFFEGGDIGIPSPLKARSLFLVKTPRTPEDDSDIRLLHLQ